MQAAACLYINDEIQLRIILQAFLSFIEDRLNPYVTPELGFEFHYFFTRKFWTSDKCVHISLSLSLCMCIYIYIYTCYTYIYVCVCMCVYIYVTYECVYIYVYACMHIHTWIRLNQTIQRKDVLHQYNVMSCNVIQCSVHIYIHIYKCIHVCIYIYICTHTHVYIYYIHDKHVYMYMYVYIYTYIYVYIHILYILSK